MFFRLPVLACCLSLSGCALQAQWQSLREMLGRSRDEVQALHEAQARATNAEAARSLREAAQDVGKPWLAGPAQALAREVALPAPLRARVDTTLIFAERAGLAVIAERLHRATGIAVRVLPEALLPPELFLPRLADNAALVIPAQPQVELHEGPKPLADILDALAARLLVWWRYRDGAIEFYRSQTQAFDLRMLPLSVQSQAQLGRRVAEAEGFDNAIQASVEVKLPSPTQMLRAQIEPFLSRSGVASLAGTEATLVVTDTPAVLARIEAFIAQQNARAGRRVRLLFEEITLLMHNSAEGAIDWRVLHASARAALEGVFPSVARTISPGLSAGLPQGPWGGSKALLSALAQFGAVRHHRSIPLLTLNRRPVTYAVHSTFSYIDQVQSLQAGPGKSELPAVSINQKRVTVGTFLTLLPDAQDDGSILLSIGYDNTSAQPLKTLAFGDDDLPLQLQQLNLDGNGSVQQVRVRPGQAVLLSGFDRSVDSYDRQRLTPDAPLVVGGKDQARQERLLTVIVLSAQLEEADG
ncbi:bacterial type II and III secretion system family protein [Bordetella holmesii 70147]|nr:bacterial type II and III secretion system family protein [Bordetella holmesii 70147]